MIFERLYRDKRQCPYCGGYDVARSQRRGFHESFLLLVLRLRPYRCLECRSRFFAYAEAVRVQTPQQGSEAA